MAQGDFGFSSLNSNLNSNNNNGFGVSTLSNLIDLIVPARVKSIVLDSSHPRFLSLGGWSALGAVEYELVTDPLASSKLSVAYPLNSNIKNYPLLEEIIFVLALPNTGIGENNSSQKSYYNNVAVWNHPHHNAYPTKSNTIQSSQNKSYDQTQVGSPSVVSPNPTQTNLGKTFVEKSNIHPLLPFEGDVIHEGRWGNSIRLGSTVKNTSNSWSSVGTNGDPITVIRNGQGAQTNQGWIPIVENVNNDDSSVYLTSTQNVPLNVAASDYTSYDKDKAPTLPNKFEGQQIILNSGRLVFSSKSDHILLSSAKSINLNAVDSVNIDTKKFITQADNIYLGENNAKEPLMLGIQTTNLLKDLVQSLTTFMEITSTATTNVCIQGAPATLPTINNAAQIVLDDLLNLSKALGSDSSLKDCNLTSKRNYTA
jgi:hypothetical protein